jgi:hypothetical protein
MNNLTFWAMRRRQKPSTTRRLRINESSVETVASERDTHKIFHRSLRDGRIAASWGDPNTLQLPHLMAFDIRGTLCVAEVNGKRVQKFGRDYA